MTRVMINVRMWSAGDRTAAVEAYAAAEEKTAGAGLKMDQAFSMLR